MRLTPGRYVRRMFKKKKALLLLERLFAFSGYGSNNYCIFAYNAYLPLVKHIRRSFTNYRGILLFIVYWFDQHFMYYFSLAIASGIKNKYLTS